MLKSVHFNLSNFTKLTLTLYLQKTNIFSPFKRLKFRNKIKFIYNC